MRENIHLKSYKNISTIMYTTMGRYKKIKNLTQIKNMHQDVPK